MVSLTCHFSSSEYFVCFRVIVTLKMWVEQCFYDFYNDENGKGSGDCTKTTVLTAMIDFCETVLLKSKDHEKWGRMLKATVERKVC